MTNDTHRQHLLTRQSALQMRVQQASNRLVLHKARTTALEQQHQVALGELKAVTDLIAEMDSGKAPELQPLPPAAPDA